jgi:colanic acid/amylovoran biosynthesis glycosyltransferase
MQSESDRTVNGEGAPRVCVWREDLLPRSETFIVNQTSALCRWDAVLSGVRTCPTGLAVSPDFTLERGGGWADRLDRGIYWRAGSSVRLHRHLKSTSLVHAHFGPDGARVARAAGLAGRPLMVTFHGYDATVPAAALGVDYSHLFKQAARLVAVSQSIGRKLVEAGAPEAKIAVLPLGIPLTPKRSPRVPGEHILFVGRLVPKKGCADLLRALTGIEGAPPLLVIGDGPLRGELEELARRLRVDASFVGARDSEYVARAMAESVALSLPSQTAPNGDQEGLPIVVLEAGAAGIPVVSYASAGIPEAVVHDETGLLASEGDVDGLAESLTAVVRDPELAARLGAAARRRVEMHFDITVRTAELEKLYDQVADEGMRLGRRYDPRAMYRSRTRTPWPGGGGESR